MGPSISKSVMADGEQIAASAAGTSSLVKAVMKSTKCSAVTM